MARLVGAHAIYQCKFLTPRYILTHREHVRRKGLKNRGNTYCVGSITHEVRTTPCSMLLERCLGRRAIYVPSANHQIGSGRLIEISFGFLSLNL